MTLLVPYLSVCVASAIADIRERLARLEGRGNPNQAARARLIHLGAGPALELLRSTFRGGQLRHG
jgi:hypothetical protein